MGEVMLVLEHEPSRRWVLEDALALRRWSPVEGVPSAYSCYFENGFIEEVRRLVSEDVHACAAQAGLTRWRAVHAWSAVPHRVLDSAAASVGASGAPAALWCDGERPVGPVADILVCLGTENPDACHTACGAALEARGWRPVAGVPRAWAHAFDLGMFEPLEPLVARDLRAAAGDAGLETWRAAWAQSTWECTELDGPRVPREIRPLPWDPTR